MSGGSWAPLLPVAMVGTDRQPLPAPAWPGVPGALLNELASAGSEPALTLLRMAGVITVCAQAGAQGVAWDRAAVIGAADEELPAADDALLQPLLGWALSEGPARLQHQVCRQLAAAGRRLPIALLPQALELGRRSQALRAPLLPVLGARGVWLAALNPAWRYAAGGAMADAGEAPWAEGSFEQRREFLRAERQRDPAAARERLAQALNELGAKERAELVGVLADRLGADDEALLDALRADRSKEVRQAALALLLALPDAALVRRAVARIEPLLRHERVLLRKKWLIDAPAEAGADWKADGIDTARPQAESLGERGWWLYQLVRRVPLAWWSATTGLSPAELRQWASSTDWGEALLRGWRDVLFATPQPDWCDAFLDDWPAAALRDDPASVLALLPAARRERHWSRQLKAGHTPLYLLLPQMLAACPPGETLSTDLSGALARLLTENAASKALADDYSLRALLPELCSALHADALDALARLPRHADESASFAQAMHAAAQVVATRRALQALTRSH